MGNSVTVPAILESETGRDARKPIAHWLHTLLVLAALGIWAYFGKLRADHLRASENIDRILMYLRTICFEWALVGFVLIGLWRSKAPFRAVLGERWSSARAFVKDLGLGLLFLFFSLMISVVFIS